MGLTHIYTGEGKGKTTAALGLALRALGHGIPVTLVQFLKGRETGELTALKLFENITVIKSERDLGLYSKASPKTRAKIIECNDFLIKESLRISNASDGCGLLILDELLTAYDLGAVDKTVADKIIFGKPPQLELVLTGRNAPPRFMETADYVTEFVKRKHPYDKGITAREGIEY